MEHGRLTEAARKYRANYIRNSRAITIMWAIFTVCLGIVTTVAFIQPSWLGDTKESPGAGYFGLFRYCEVYATGADHVCFGDLDDFGSILSVEFRVATVFVGLATLLVYLSCMMMLLFFFRSSSLVLSICGWLQGATFVLLFLGCVIYPGGWGHDKVRAMCGLSADRYNRGDCAIRWAYILAILAMFDALVLTVLAFVLATRQAKLAAPDESEAAPTPEPENEYNNGVKISQHNTLNGNAVYDNTPTTAGTEKHNGFANPGFASLY